MTIAFDTEPEDGLTVRDVVERRQYTLRTGDPVDPESVSTDRFTFPLDGAVAVETASVTLPTVVATYVRDGDGQMVAEAEHFAHHELPPGEYSIELCAPVKLYLRVESELVVSADAERLTLSFDGTTEVLVGARSHHERPAGTITTTGEPRDVMRAVSHLGSALKTTSPERSYPTLRGHPPTIEHGAEFSVPDDVEPPDTGVRIEVPPDLEHAFVVAPLAYYLGATVVPGDRPRLVTDSGPDYPLDGPAAGTSGFENAVARVLKQTFLLDCVTRTEGLYQVDLHERRAVEAVVDLDFADLYDRSLAERLEAYLSVPYDVVADHVPEWKLTTHVAPTPDNVEMLPFVVDDLAVVKTPAGSAATAPEPAVDAIDDFVRSAADTGGSTPSLVDPEHADSLEQAWVGDEAPLGASKATAEAFRNKLARDGGDGDVTISVVCNDEKMLEEHTVAGEVYGSRDELPFEVDLRSRLTTAELRDLLASDVDFLHYVGHIDDEGFECADGKLDAAELEEVGVDAFVLNACTSYRQGMALIEAGAIGGVVTVADVVDGEAVDLGKSMARLLNRGFPLRAALNVAGEQSLVGDQYMVVGDGNLNVTQAESGTPILVEINADDDSYDVKIKSFPSAVGGMGSMIRPHFQSADVHTLVSGMGKSFNMSESEIVEMLELEEVPVYFEEEFMWGSELRKLLST